jgi:hypothetical protein
LPDGVTAARLTLDQLVKVRILLRQLPILPAKSTEYLSIDSCLKLFYTNYYTNAPSSESSSLPQGHYLRERIEVTDASQESKLTTFYHADRFSWQKMTSRRNGMGRR